MNELIGEMRREERSNWESDWAEGVLVAGAGLAGCEAAWQLANRGVSVRLLDIKPHRRTPAHHSDLLAELVCSNSLRANGIENAVGLLKEEMRRLDSLIMEAADCHAIPAGGALAVDREGFSAEITQRLLRHPLVTFVTGELRQLPDRLSVIATGPLTTDTFFEAMADALGQQHLAFFDAAAPIVTVESLNLDAIFCQSRYDKGTADYLNCPMDREQYLAFHEALTEAEMAPLHGFERDDPHVFEGCVPIEVMARRGVDTMRFGPLKPVGLMDPATGQEPYAVVQLRQDDAARTLYNLVGFQTNLKFAEQRRVFGMIPGLEKAEFARYGIMHCNRFLNAPALLDIHARSRRLPHLYFAGQLSGVEGYVESAASGLLCGINAARQFYGKPLIDFPSTTACGALLHYIAAGAGREFQPMNVNFGIISPPDFRFKGKTDKNRKLAARALAAVDQLKAT